MVALTGIFRPNINYSDQQHIGSFVLLMTLAFVRTQPLYTIVDTRAAITIIEKLLYFKDHTKVPFVVTKDGTVGKVRIRNDIILPARTAAFVVKICRCLNWINQV